MMVAIVTIVAASSFGERECEIVWEAVCEMCDIAGGDNANDFLR